MGMEIGFNNLFSVPQGMKRLLEECPKKTDITSVFFALASPELLSFSQTCRDYNLLVETEFSERINQAVASILKINMTSLNEDEIRTICTFVEKFFQSAVNQNKFIHEKENWKLEYDPLTKQIFIHTNDFIGRGCNKFVTKSILYNAHHPIMAAAAKQYTDKSWTGNEAEEDMDRELLFHRKLAGQDRLIEFIAAPPSCDDVLTIITKYYPLGTLKYFDKNLLSIKDKISMVRDVVQGIMNMHSMGIGHYDLWGDNMLVEENVDPELLAIGVKYRLVIIDFGLSYKCTPYLIDNDIYDIGVLSSPKKLRYPKTDLHDIDYVFPTPEEGLQLISRGMKKKSSLRGDADYWHLRLTELLYSID